MDGSDLVILAEQVSFLILKREWQKCGLKISIVKEYKVRWFHAPLLLVFSSSIVFFKNRPLQRA
jgi:hypothetical protein